MNTKISTKIDVKERLSIKIDGNWMATDVINLFTAIQDLYDYYCCIYILELESIEISTLEGKVSLTLTDEIEKDKLKILAFLNQRFLGKQTTFIDAKNEIYKFDRDFNQRENLFLNTLNPLKLLKYQYASPGFTDFLGAAEIIGHVKDFCFKIIDLINERKIKKENLRGLKLENDLKEIEIKREYLKLFKELGFDESEILKINEMKNKTAIPIAKLYIDEKLKEIE